MLELGKKQRLTVLKETGSGLYLGETENPQETVLLPGKEIPDGAKRYDTMEVFLYKDSRGRLIATRREPALQLGGLAVLQVAEVNKVGAFLKWGLDRDLLLPYKEQTRKVKAGESHLVALYIDKSGRLCATMNVYPYLDTDSPYHKDDAVRGVVYETSKTFGEFVAVDNRYSALIPRKDAAAGYRIGDTIEARVTRVREDGKLELSTRKKAYLQMDDDAEHIMKVIEKFGGELPFSDKAAPEVIQRELGLSKSAFKRGVGRLFRERRVEITEHSIRKIKKEEHKSYEKSNRNR